MQNDKTPGEVDQILDPDITATLHKKSYLPIV